MKKSLYIPVKPILLLALLLLASCSEDDQHVLSLLEKAETVMEEYPDSAYRLLCEADSGIAEQSKGTRIRHFLLKTEADNKLYHPLPSDTLFQDVVDYYDGHGTANQQLKAHYLLGCIYRDRGEAPMALQCFNNAVEKADTLSDDCDYTTLFSVYGQMADIFEAQVMPNEALKALEQYCQYAKKAGNTYESIRGIEFMAAIYNLKRDTTMILLMEKQAAELYTKYNMPQAAASARVMSIRININRANYQEAQQLMNTFEKKSDLFDKDGNICRGREHYYHTKGLYYLGIGQLDSAEHEFKRLIPYGYTFDAYHGLIEVSQQRKDANAVLAYTKLYEESLDTLVTNIHAEATRQVEGMYDYTRHQRIASEERMKSERRLNIIYAILLLVILASTIIFHLYTKAKAKKMLEIRLLKQQLVNLSERYTRTEEELDMMENNFAALNELKEKKEQELIDLQEQLREFRERYKEELKDDVVAFSKSPIVLSIKKKADSPSCMPLTDKEKSSLIDEFQLNMPRAYAKLANENKLSELEFYVAILTRIEIRTKYISQLLDVLSNSVSNAKTSANKKLFSADTGRSFYYNLRNI